MQEIKIDVDEERRQLQAVSTDRMEKVDEIDQLEAEIRGESEYDYHLKAQTHHWTVLVQHKATEDILDKIDGKLDEMPVLDTSTLMGMPLVVCSICHEAYAPLLRLRKCKGEARD